MPLTRSFLFLPYSLSASSLAHTDTHTYRWLHILLLVADVMTRLGASTMTSLLHSAGVDGDHLRFVVQCLLSPLFTVSEGDTMRSHTKFEADPCLAHS